jgi:hypothetical protein
MTHTFFQVHEMDWDGLAAASKVLTDGLKIAGIIRNDSPKDIPQPILKQAKVEHIKDEHVEIQIDFDDPKT